LKTRIPKERHFNRIEIVQERLKEKGAENAIFFNAQSIFYLSGFFCVMTERPVALVIPNKGDLGVIVPKLEEDSVKKHNPWIKDVHAYFDYPGEKHPMKHIVDFLKERNLDQSLGADMFSAPGRSGYVGPALTDLLDRKIVDIKDIVPSMRVIKDEDEIELIRTNGLWGNLAHSILQRNTILGRYDFEVSHLTEIETTKIMLDALGPDFEQQSRSGLVGAKLSGVGPGSAFPHAIGGPWKVNIGDGIVTYAETYVGGGFKGYICELERTMFMGPPTEKQQKFFEIMVKAQDVAFETYSPGVKCSEVDKAVMTVFKDENVLEFARHHTGHNSGGLEVHEAPYIDVGEDIVMQPNMVFSCEPGLYVPGLGGFRHSDCVRITEDGAEIMTYYPRDINSLTIIP